MSGDHQSLDYDETTTQMNKPITNWLSNNFKKRCSLFVKESQQSFLYLRHNSAEAKVLFIKVTFMSQRKQVGKFHFLKEKLLLEVGDTKTFCLFVEQVGLILLSFHFCRVYFETVSVDL